MSFNQSRSDKNDSHIQYRKSGRSTSFNQQRGSLPTHSKTGGAGGSAPSPSIAPNRSFKKSNNAQGGQPRVVGVPTVNSADSTNAPTPRGVQNGDYAQTQPRATSDAKVMSAVAKPIEMPPTQRSTRDVPKAPTSQSPSLSSDTIAPTTPAKGSGDQSKEFSFQFGSISPGIINGIQIPVRTSSAPPNLDEQKRDQARHDPLRPAPPLPIPSAPKPQTQKKDAGAADQSTTGQQLQKNDVSVINQPNIGEAHTIQKIKKDVQTSPTHLTNQIPKPTVPSISAISMPMPFHQPQVSVPFGGPNQQIQSQGIAASSLHMSMSVPLQIGSSQVQQQMFVPGLHPHPMQPQGIIHQGQSLGFATQLGSQLPPQISNLGINVSSQYSPQQAGKFGSARKSSVRITDPKTHEELVFDNKQTDAYADTGSSGPRSQYSIPSQTQPLPYASNHAMNYYPNSYNPNSVYFGQTAPNSQPHRYNFPVSQSSQNVSYINPSPLGSIHVKKTVGSPMHSIADQPNRDHTRDTHTLQAPAPSGTVHVTIKMPADPVGGKVSDSIVNRSFAIEEGKSQKPSSPTVEINQSSQKTSDISPESTLPEPKVVKEVLLKTSPISSKQSSEAHPVVSPDCQDSCSLQPSLAASFSEPQSAVTNNEGKRETLACSDPYKDHQKKVSKKGNTQLQHQISGQSTSLGPVQEHSITTRPEISEDKTPINSATDENKAESAKEISLPVSSITFDSTEGSNLASIAHSTSEMSVDGNSDLIFYGKQDASKDKHPEQLPLRMEEHGQAGYAELPIDLKGSVNFPENDVSKSVEFAEQTGDEPVVNSPIVSNEVSTSKAAQGTVVECVSSHGEVANITDKIDVSTSTTLNSTVSENSHVDELLVLDNSSSRNDDVSSNEVARKGGRLDQASEIDKNVELSEGKHDGELLDTVVSGSISQAVAGSRDKSLVEMGRVKSTTKGRKKLKEILQKADAAGTTSDLYMAYKGPEEKKETVMHLESVESTESRPSSVDSKQQCSDPLKEDTIVCKAEPEDWEDAADIAAPKLETSHVDGSNSLVFDHGDKIGDMAKKYSRDFLLKFAEQFVDLPHGFVIAPESEPLMSNHVSISHHPDRDSYPSPGRVERPSSGGSRLDRRGSNLVDEDRWGKPHGPFVSGQDPRWDLAYGANSGFRPGQGANFGVLRNPRAQGSVQFVGGLLAGPMQTMGSQGGMQRSSPDAERWQRATNFHKGLIPSPQTPLQTMHKAQKKYEVGKVSDEEEAKQRQLKGILNKLTPQNFDKLFEQVKSVNIDNVRTLNGVISQIFDKALMEPTFCEMYANFCHHLAGELPDLSEDNEKITFKRLLLNKCQEEFERGEREQEEANKVEEGEIKQSEEEREEKRIKARRRMLGNIRLIGELYKKKMLTERIMHECIKKLLGEYQNPDEEDVESLCKLMSTIGEMIDHPRAKDYMDSYFDIMLMLSNNMKLSSRVRFMLKDAIDLRKNKWQQRRKVEGPKKIEEVHRDAAQERQAQTGRFGRGPGINTSGRRGPVMDYGPRGSAVSSPSSQSFRGFPHQSRGFGSQDARQEERQSYEARTLSVPLPQRSSGDDSITLGPQGGLARGMSIRGPQPMSATPADITPIPGDFRNATTATLNGYSSVSERGTFTAKEDQIPRHMPDRFAGQASLEQSGQERYLNYGSRELRHSSRSFDRSRPISPATQGQGPSLASYISSEKAPSEDRLRELSMAAIKEFYSARDEKEVAMCVKELHSPSFHPTMICLWVTDSFERKDLERDLLAKLIVNLSKSHDDTLSQTHLVKGFESVLATLEDAVNDAPRAPEFLSRILAKVTLEKLVSLNEIGELIYQGGEEPGCLVQGGLAADVIGNVLEAIRSEKGENFLNEILTNSKLRLETFRPPDPIKSKILEKFI